MSIGDDTRFGDFGRLADLSPRHDAPLKTARRVSTGPWEETRFPLPASNTAQSNRIILESSFGQVRKSVQCRQPCQITPWIASAGVPCCRIPYVHEYEPRKMTLPRGSPANPEMIVTSSEQKKKNTGICKLS